MRPPMRPKLNQLASPFPVRLGRQILWFLVGLATATTVIAAEPKPTLEAKPTLETKVYDQSLSRAARLAAARELTGFHSDPKRVYRICIWDPVGRSGPIYSNVKAQEIKLLELGIKAQMDPYTSETVMVEELKAGTCDAALMTGLRARAFNSYTGTLDSPGSLLNLQDVRLVYRLMADPRSADKMVAGNYVNMGILPGGAAYIFVNDRSVDTIEEAAGKRVTVLDYDPMQARLVAGLGATPVMTDIANAPNKFNNGDVDITAAPLIAYEFMELYKGLEPNGGIIDFPLIHASMQMIGRADVFPNPIAQLVRELMHDAFDLAMELVNTESAKVPKKWFVAIPEPDKPRYEKVMQEVRLNLSKEGYYNPDMLTILRKVRCKNDPSRPECTNPVE